MPGQHSLAIGRVGHRLVQRGLVYGHLRGQVAHHALGDTALGREAAGLLQPAPGIGQRIAGLLDLRRGALGLQLGEFGVQLQQDVTLLYNTAGIHADTGHQAAGGSRKLGRARRGDRAGQAQ